MTRTQKEGSASSSPHEGLLDIVHVGDARTATKAIPDNFINLTITSPPYFDLKDYGMPKQIGFGQQYDDYLNDLASVFSEVFRATRGDGSLWIVVDTFRKDQEVFPLPFDLATRLKPIGWTLRDIIIWKKERTLPWTQAGATRKIFEYILVFSKGINSFRYDPDKYRQTSDLKRWWVRYPERYNPKGKSLEEIWSYDIPTQGSWGAKYIRHFCPLPSELVSRIIQLTTGPDGIVLDPFAGSGTVPTVSHLLGRSFIGIELNPAYVKMFENHLKQQKAKESQQAIHFDDSEDKESFAKTIVNLRVLKFGRLILRTLRKERPDDSVQIYAFRLPDKADQKFKHYAAEYLVVLPESQAREAVIQKIEELCSKPPLSKFGIQATLKFIKSKRQVSPARQKLPYYRYTHSNSHFNVGRANFSQIWAGDGELFSPIKLEVEEPHE
ncbi:MAG TPA: site-specific DNA-methyltransferase [Polaromonas sp.]|uniref:DNA-methyltransferase n=1 Tax=Polaromonas sp. UBA4122 TaxID=1947074 RepID=UPI000EBE0F58|nr:DNA methyltransferase [Polaromonas sp. UBA4122]HAL40377.1 site-specific DNA-methyltransferase [Polaromonas sp.]